MYILRIIVLLCLYSVSANAQRTCAAHEIFQQKMKEYPDFRESQELMNKQVSSSRSSVEGIITIPVVVHVVYNSSAENISDEQIYSQLEVLNEDFRRLNNDADNIWSQAADSEIEFCLASRDPNGDATCGITRTYTATTKFEGKTDMKGEATGGKSGWPPEDYLNIWVCDISGLLGFATFPNDPDRDEDGIVVDYLSFGRVGDLKERFDLGRTATHEVGHWLNLRHIWGDGDCFDDDLVSDTPVAGADNSGCDIGHISCGSVDMVQNYMDYSDDVCMNLFTIGQRVRMRALFEPGGYKESFLTSKGCDAPSSCNAIAIDVKFDDYPADISWTLSDDVGLIIDQGSGYNDADIGQTVRVFIDCIVDGRYHFEIQDSYGDGLCCNEGAGDYTIYSIYEYLVVGSGSFGSGETTSFELRNNYRFIGPGNEWINHSNWQLGEAPSECYDGVISIEADCEVDALIVDSKISVVVKNGAKLTVK